jgi:CheY-like chemotaxis protein
MKKRILVVDEDELVLYALSKALENDGCEVKTTGSVTSAMEKLTQFSCDLCFLDMDLTKSHNTEIISKIREVCPDTKIILMAADHFSPDDICENFIQAINSDGSCHIIPKPFNLYDVTEMVQNVFDGKFTNIYPYQFIGAGFEKKSRKHPRNPWTEKIFFQTTIIHQGVNTRLSVEAEAVDISDCGIGFLTPYPLKELQVISFDEKLDRKIGVVAWSKMLDRENCRVGVKFV